MAPGPHFVAHRAMASGLLHLHGKLSCVSRFRRGFQFSRNGPSERTAFSAPIFSTIRMVVKPSIGPLDFARSL